jgi:hypothetical protein
VITDRAPGSGEPRRQFDESDAQTTLALPPLEPFQAASRALQAALIAEDRAAVKRAGESILDLLGTTYAIDAPSLSVLGERPRKVSEHGGSYELFGDYTFETATIRVWMRTAVLGKVTSYRGLLNTILHEFCHHLDVKSFGYVDTPHTRGFYHRVDDLYHLALATPPDKRKPLVWIRRGPVYRIDWSKLR